MRKVAMKNLEPKAEVGNFQSVTDRDSVFYSESLKGKRWVIAVINADSSRDTQIKNLLHLEEQASSEFAINIYILVGLFPSELISTMSKQLQLPARDNWVKTYMASNHVYPFAMDAFSIPESYKNKNVLIFLDEFGRIRQYYDLTNHEQLLDAIRELPVFLSLKK